MSEHLNVVVSINIVRHELLEIVIGSLEKWKKLLLVGICSTSSRLDYMGWILVMRLRSIDFNLMIVFDVG